MTMSWLDWSLNYPRYIHKSTDRHSGEIIIKAMRNRPLMLIQLTTTIA